MDNIHDFEPLLIKVITKSGYKLLSKFFDFTMLLEITIKEEEDQLILRFTVPDILEEESKQNNIHDGKGFNKFIKRIIFKKDPNNSPFIRSHDRIISGEMEVILQLSYFKISMKKKPNISKLDIEAYKIIQGKSNPEVISMDPSKFDKNKVKWPNRFTGSSISRIKDFIDASDIWNKEYLNYPMIDKPKEIYFAVICKNMREFEKFKSVQQRRNNFEEIEYIPIDSIDIFFRQRGRKFYQIHILAIPNDIRDYMIMESIRDIFDLFGRFNLMA